MGYDRQRSPFATRLFLTCYCLFLLVNILIYSNKVQLTQIEMIFLCLISLILFAMIFYGLWFAKIFILCFTALLLSVLLCTTFTSSILILTNDLPSKSSIYFAHNYLWLMKVTKNYLLMINLSISLLVNIFALWGTCHLCSCIEHRDDSWPYRKRTTRISQTII